MHILADSNILLRLFDLLHSHYPIVDRALESLRTGGHEFVVVPQNLYEFWAVATRPRAQNGMGMTTAEADDALRRVLRVFRLLRDERTVVEFWHALVVGNEVKGKQAHDARLAAAMQRHAVSHLLTFNGADFTRYPFITVLSPGDVAAGATGVS